MKSSPIGLLFALVCMCSPLFAGPQENKAEGAVGVVETGSAVLTLRFDDKVITFEGKPDCEIIVATIQKVIERRGIDGLRLEYSTEISGLQWKPVPLVGEKKAARYRFLHSEDGNAVCATKDPVEAIRAALKFLGIESQARGDDKK